jgi:hypothetical protein
LQERAAAAGRDPIPVTLFYARPEFLERYEEIGVARCVFVLSAGPTEAVLGELDELAMTLGGQLSTPMLTK